MNPPYLHKGDTIAIAATARHISKEELTPAISFFEGHGFKVLIPDSLFQQENQYAGSDDHRAERFNELITRDEVNAIVLARGGYGTARMVDKIDWAQFQRNPKWIVGFSDATVILNHAANLGIHSIHGPMCSTIPSTGQQELEWLASSLKGELNAYDLTCEVHRSGETQGRLVGGNLSVLYSIQGSSSSPLLEGSILFIEDLDEYLYHIDRMMVGLKRAGVFDKISALVVGGMSDMRDNTIKFGFDKDNPFGRSAKEIIKDAVNDYDFPVVFDFPAGHISRNSPLYIGRHASIKIENGRIRIGW